MKVTGEQREILLDRFQGSLLGVAIGDAMGVPFEVLADDEIKDLGAGEVTGFRSVERIGRRSGQKKIVEPRTSDDWQLTEVVASSLIQRGRLDVLDMAKSHIFAMEQSSFGWGGTTRKSVEDFSQWFLTDGKEGRNPRIFAQGNGIGNGIAMKVAPLALFDSVSWEGTGQKYTELAKDVEVLGRMTHGDVRATTAGFGVAYLISRILHSQLLPADSEDSLAKLFDMNTLTGELLHYVGFVENQYNGGREAKDPFIQYLQKIEEIDLKDPAAVRNTFGVDGHACQSIPFSIATFLRHPFDFRAGILEAINAGGDTDSNAAIVGSMIGANVGLSGIPEEWRDYLPEFRKCLWLAEQLLNKALKD